MSVKETLAELNATLDDMEEQEKFAPRPRIGEHEFRRVHLPRFWYHGQKHPETNKPIQVNLSDWAFNVAGGFFNEVDVVNDSTGEVIFVVPPLIPQVGIPVGNVVYEVADSKETIPSSALIKDAVNSIGIQRNLRGATRDINSIADMYMRGMSPEAKQALVDQHYAKWDIIFDRYVPNRAKRSVGANVALSASDDFDEEDTPLF